MMFVEGELACETHGMVSPKYNCILSFFYDTSNPVKLEDIDDGKILKMFNDFNGKSTGATTRIEMYDLKTYVEDYIEAYDLFFLDFDGERQPQIEVEVIEHDY